MTKLTEKEILDRGYENDQSKFWAWIDDVKQDKDFNVYFVPNFRLPYVYIYDKRTYEMIRMVYNPNNWQKKVKFTILSKRTFNRWEWAHQTNHGKPYPFFYYRVYDCALFINKMTLEPDNTVRQDELKFARIADKRWAIKNQKEKDEELKM